VSILQAIESGVPYGAVNTNGVDPMPYVTNPNNAYLTPPASTATAYIFGPRDEFLTKGQRRTDVAVNYVYRLPGASRMQLFGEVQVLNVFNQFQRSRMLRNVHCNPATYSATALISSSVRRAATVRMTRARSLLRAPLLKSTSCCTV
jgi:hypothetical protein